MPIETLTCAPPKFEAGNTVVWAESFPDFPASEWALAFILSIGGIKKLSVDADPDGDDFTVTLTAADTGELASGTYDWAEYVTKYSERATIRTGTVIVLPNLAEDQEPSFAQSQVELLQGALAKLAAGTNESVNINGQSFTKRNIEIYQKQLTYWEARVFQEQQRQAALRGNRTDGRIRIAFESPYDGTPPYRAAAYGPFYP